MKIEEFEEKILTSTGWVTRTQLDQMNAEKLKKMKSPHTPEFGPPSKRCPYKSGADKSCDGERCAWYVMDKCAQTCPNPSAGRRCPVRGDKCMLDCALRGE